jgi:hypothetical protein
MSRKLFLASLAVAMLISATQAEAARRRPVHSTEPPFNPAFTEGGYADATSVRQGSSINLRIATSVSPFSLRVFNLARPTEVLLTRQLTSQARNCSGRGTSGCGWPVTTTIDIPQVWTPGYYGAFFPTAFGDRWVIFVVKEDVPATWSRTVVISPTNTYQAYNDYGGRSFAPSDDPNRINHLSFDRPYDEESGLGRYVAWEKLLVDFMTSDSRRFEVITDTDMEDPTILSRYDVAIIAGHSEYWTSAARRTLEQFSESGGHLAILGGNTMWWQVRLEDNKRTIVAFKGAPYDPQLGNDDDLVTTNWFTHPVNDPENRILGASFRNGGFANKLNDIPDNYTMKPVEQRTPWTVTDAGHWIFAGTNLVNGARFGREAAGLEVDGVVFNCGTNGNVLGPDGSDEAPLNYHILAILPASAGWGTMGFYVNQSGGGIFNAATQGWLFGLANDPTIRQMTRNVLDRFSFGNPFVYDPVQTSVVVMDTFNCPATLIANPGWRGNVGRGTTTSSCAYEGPGGLDLSGNGAIALARSLAPAEQSRDRVKARFYVKADELQQRTDNPMAILILRSRTEAITTTAASVELDRSGNTRRIRVARRGPDGFVASPFVTLSDGWHLVEMSWRSPGTITLQVDDGTPVTLENPHAGQNVNELVLSLPETTRANGGKVCLDALTAEVN